MALQTTNAAYQPVTALEKAVTSGWNPVCKITYTRDTWVKLLDRPSDYAHDEAMLLCQEAGNQWVMWIPEHGEARLDRSQFYFVQ
ncbi:MAG: hypothetical protein AAFQ57_14020 [Cyanobacteria bacterium J06626_14]